MKMAVLWVVAPCSLVEVHQHFGGTSTRLHSATTQKTAIFSFYLVNMIIVVIAFCQSSDYMSMKSHCKTEDDDDNSKNNNMSLILKF
jgi:hypothetical protein